MLDCNQGNELLRDSRGFSILQLCHFRCHVTRKKLQHVISSQPLAKGLTLDDRAESLECYTFVPQIAIMVTHTHTLSLCWRRAVSMEKLETNFLTTSIPLGYTFRHLPWSISTGLFEEPKETSICTFGP